MKIGCCEGSLRWERQRGRAVASAAACAAARWREQLTAYRRRKSCAATQGGRYSKGAISEPLAFPHITASVGICCFLRVDRTTGRMCFSAARRAEQRHRNGQLRDSQVRQCGPNVFSTMSSKFCRAFYMQVQGR